ncbi:MAG: tryptophan--tRNA ligase [Patescibacteria group bacterium]|nr:tryptophan--tRNA ligase [Patescibacteria group bacterium]
MALKPRIFSGIQPTGALHIGNYLGAIKQWLILQETSDCIFCVVDYHAITVKYEPKEMQQRIFYAALDYLAAGLDPKKSIIFVQSHVPEHSELAWLLNTVTPVGELRRMTQWKDKISYEPKFEISINDSDFRHLNNTWKVINENILNGSNDISNITNRISRATKTAEKLLDLVEGMLEFDAKLNTIKAGLLNYPILMAADILLYKTHIVPVGEDQQQHVELTRTIARKFNSQFGETFIVPKAQLSQAQRIMSLADPTKKMSKSLGPKHYLALTDTPGTIREKISRAVTDVGSEGGEMSPGVKNLFVLLKEFGAPAEIKKFESAYADKTIRYSELKEALADAIVKKLKPFQNKRADLAKEPKKVWKILNDGAKRARPIAQKTLAEVKEKMGL